MNRISVERAIEILDPNHRECYSDLPDGMEQVKEACRMGMEALQAIYSLDGKPSEYEPTNAEMMIKVLSDIIANGADDEKMGVMKVNREILFRKEHI